MPHPARRVLCTPVFKSLRSRSWLKAQMTELRSAETYPSTSLILSESAHYEFVAKVCTGESSFRKRIPYCPLELFSHAEIA
jgi:hypothetical protein